MQKNIIELAAFFTLSYINEYGEIQNNNLNTITVF